MFFRFANEGGFRPEDLKRRFTFIDVETGSIRIKNGSRLFLVNQLFIEPEEADSILRMISSIQGNVVCWHNAPSASEIREFLRCIEVDDTFTQAANYLYGDLPIYKTDIGSDDNVGRQGGRPRKIDTIADAYLKLFPDGHRGMTRKMLLRAISQEIGYDFGLDSLDRALDLLKK